MDIQDMLRIARDMSDEDRAEAMKKLTERYPIDVTEIQELSRSEIAADMVDVEFPPDTEFGDHWDELDEWNEE